MYFNTHCYSFCYFPRFLQLQLSIAFLLCLFYERSCYVLAGDLASRALGDGIDNPDFDGHFELQAMGNCQHVSSSCTTHSIRHTFANFLATCEMTSFSLRLSLASAFGTTHAQTTSPYILSGTPKETASPTPGTERRAESISKGEIFSPATKIGIVSFYLMILHRALHVQAHLG